MDIKSIKNISGGVLTIEGVSFADQETQTVLYDTTIFGSNAGDVSEYYTRSFIELYDDDDLLISDSQIAWDLITKTANFVSDIDVTDARVGLKDTSGAGVIGAFSVSTSTDLNEDSDSAIATQKATKSYVDSNPGTQGPQGDQGADGSDGPQGVAGSDGAQGADGSDGVQGADGAQGPQGFQGPQGDDGGGTGGTSSGESTFNVALVTDTQSISKLSWSTIFIPTHDMTVTTLSCLTTQSGSGNTRMGIYDSTQTTLLAESSNLAALTQGLNLFTLTSSVTLTEGTLYYVAIQSHANGAVLVGHASTSLNTPQLARRDINNATDPLNGMATTVAGSATGDVLWAQLGVS